MYHGDSWGHLGSKPSREPITFLLKSTEMYFFLSSACHSHGESPSNFGKFLQCTCNAHYFHLKEKEQFSFRLISLHSQDNTKTTRIIIKILNIIMIIVFINGMIIIPLCYREYYRDNDGDDHEHYDDDNNNDDNDNYNEIIIEVILMIILM